MVSTSGWATAAQRAVCVIGSAIVVAGIAGACSEPSADLPERPDDLPSPVSAPSPTMDPEHARILAAYASHIEAYDEASRRGDPDYPELLEHADGPALESAQRLIGAYVSTDWLFTGGRTVVQAEVVHYDPEPELDDLGELPDDAVVFALAEVNACLDVSEFLPVDANDGSFFATEYEVDIHVSGALLRYYEDEERWLVFDEWLEWAEPC